MKKAVNENVILAFAVYSIVVIAPFCISIVIAILAVVLQFRHIDTPTSTLTPFEIYGPLIFLWMVPILCLIIAGYVVSRIIRKNSWIYLLTFGFFWVSISIFLFFITGWGINPVFMFPFHLLLLIFLPPLVSFIASLFYYKK